MRGIISIFFCFGYYCYYIFKIIIILYFIRYTTFYNKFQPYKK